MTVSSKGPVFFHYSNGVIEGLNNLIKVIKKIAFGYWSFVQFEIRISLIGNTMIKSKEAFFRLLLIISYFVLELLSPTPDFKEPFEIRKINKTFVKIVLLIFVIIFKTLSLYRGTNLIEILSKTTPNYQFI